MADSSGSQSNKTMTNIVVFASSLSVASILVLVKALELRFGKRNALLKLIGRLDAKALSTASSLKFRSLQLIQSARYIVLVKSKEVAKSLFEKAWGKIVIEYRERERVMMGQKNITNKGAVSFFLKKIDESKEKKGEIL